MLQIIFAVLAGVLTVASPCILPVLPIVLGTSVGQQAKSRPLFIVLGFIVSFAGTALIFSSLTRIAGISQNNLRAAGIVLLLVFGLLMLLPKIFERIISFLNPYINKVSAAQGSKAGNFGGFLIGLTIGFIWTPCAGPVLAAILTLIATTKDLLTSGILLVFYALGAGIPMIIIAYGSQYLTTRVRAIARYARPLQQIFGILIISLAIAMYFNYDILIQAKIAAWYPSLAAPKY
jgi:cytochrome c biogenesis protein CcdA